MKRQNIFRAGLTIAILFLLLAPFSAALAGQPEKFEWEGSGKDPELLNCGDFVIDGEWSEWDKWREFYDEEGNWERTVGHVHFLGKLTNRETGLTVRDEGYINYIVESESTTEQDTGLIWSINIPGQGIVALDAGVLVWDFSTWDLLHEGGPHQVLHGLDVWGNMCTYMGG